MSEGPTKTETLAGGSSRFVKTRMGAAIEVRVAQLSIRKLQALVQAIGERDEARQVELYCDKPQGWADDLALESIEDIIGVGERLNWDFFERFLQRRSAREERIWPGQHEALLKIAAGMASASPTTSPGAPSPAV